MEPTINVSGGDEIHVKVLYNIICFIHFSASEVNLLLMLFYRELCEHSGAPSKFGLCIGLCWVTVSNPLQKWSRFSLEVLDFIHINSTGLLLTLMPLLSRTL